MHTYIHNARMGVGAVLFGMVANAGMGVGTVTCDMVCTCGESVAVCVEV